MRTEKICKIYCRANVVSGKYIGLENDQIRLAIENVKKI